MTIDRAELFRLAWAWAKQDLWSRRLPASHLRGLFREALKRAWADMKRTAARLAAQRKTTAATRSAAQIQTDILLLECKDCLRGSDWQHLDALRVELMAAYAA